ncbi:MAG: glycosyltransferase family 39 protein [Chloroflexota bacterium]|nr:glycosyltransferase family 39 protein [Chloroflexota bacterium]
MTKSQISNTKHKGLSFVTCHLSLLAFALRLYRLNGQSIWVDEGISLHLATSSLAEIIANRAANIHPPLYFFLLKGWVTLAGTSIFSVRFFSALASLLQMAAIYTIARRWLGQPTARVAALITALSPLSVIYAQEARVYALLPLIYLALLAITHELTHKPGPHRRTMWLFLGIVEVIGLHLHYMILFVVAYAGGWSLLTFWRERRWTDLRHWWTTQLLVGLASLPWLIAVLTHWPAVQARIQRGQGFTESVPLDYLLSQVWVFHLTGLASAVGSPKVRLLASLTLLLLTVSLLLRLIRPATRRPAARLMAHWLIPLGSALLVWSVRPFSHPRYIALYAPGLTLLAAYAIHPNSKAQTPKPKPGHCSLVIGHCSLLTLLLISLLGLRSYFFDPAFAKDDVRGLAAWLEAETTAADLIVTPWQDWSLDYAYHGPATIIRPNPGAEAATWETLAAQTATARRVFLVDYPRDNRDRRNLLPFALESTGSLIERHSFKGLLVRLYELDSPPSSPPLEEIEESLGGHFAPLRLTAAWVEQNPPADTAVTVALHWHCTGVVTTPLRVNLRLRDLDGWELSASDDWLLNDAALPTDHWPSGEQATTYHVLPLVPGIPPLTYTLSLGVYTTDAEGNVRPLDLLDVAGNPQGQSYDVGSVTLSPARGLRDDPYSVALDLPPLPEPAALADNLLLEAAALDRQTAAPGQSLHVTLRWRSRGAVTAPPAITTPLPDLRPTLTLSQAGSTLVTVDDAPAGGRYPTDLWQPGEVVLEHHSLTIPPTAADGPASLTIELGDRRVILGRVEITAGEHLFAPPPLAHEVHIRFGHVAELLGYDLPPSPSYEEGSLAGERIVPITLYWRALEGAASANYTVFTHVLAADGHLVALHDGPPASGTRPTPGWLPGEIIADHHEMSFREAYTGPAVIEVGLYDSTTLERVVAATGETFVILPSPLNVEGQ